MKAFHTWLAAAAAIAAMFGLADAQGEEMKPKEIRYPSSADGTMQPAMFHTPKTTEPVPLLVALHTWSGDYRQDYHDACAKWCVKTGWACIHPDFRGPNNRPEACGSELVVKDILSAVKYAKQVVKIDDRRIYLVGSSGGGYAALLMAGRAPKMWAGVSAWVGISDLKAWHDECTRRRLAYAAQIERCCGGPPGASAAVDLEYRKRSPNTWLKKARGVPLDINAGITDGHTGSVPISHSLRAFNCVADETDRIDEADIRYLTEKAEKGVRNLFGKPNHALFGSLAQGTSSFGTPKRFLTPFSPDDASYGAKVPLFRRTSGKARVTIFRGGHELVSEAAMTWLEKQRKE